MDVVAEASLKGLMELDVLTLDGPSRVLIGATVTGIAANALQVRKRALQTKEKPSSTPKQREAKNGAAHKPPALDDNFVRRLTAIMQILVPSWRSQEAAIVVVQTLTLLCRTLLSLRIARCGGEGIKAVMHRSMHGFLRCLLDFSLTGIVAGVVNSALKFHTNMLTVRFRERLTQRVHERYCRGTRYYRAATLKSRGLDHLDQRVAEDIHQFCATLSDLHGRTFKPALDALLCTVRMAQSMGWGGLTLLYAYYLSIGSVTRRFSPPFARLIAEQQAHEGELRHCHGAPRALARLLAHAEEVALLDGGVRERGLLDAALARTTAFSRSYYLLQFYQGTVDQWSIKYGASLIGWPVLAIPFLRSSAEGAEVAARYREADTLIQNACGAIGDLMLIYKKVQRLAGLTTRVSELLEALDRMAAEEQPDAALAEAAPAGSSAEGGSDLKAGEEAAASLGAAEAAAGAAAPEQPSIVFDGVTVFTPDARCLVKGLSLRLPRGRHLLVTGPNGAGKSSLVRALKGLWPLQQGVVRLPVAAASEGGVHYVPQNAYMMSGTLRDQVLYPEVPLLPAEEGAATQDARAAACMRAMGLAKLLGDLGLDAWQQDWLEVLSGGEKQRVGLARLLYHRPAFAVLDEATSAVNSDEQARLHEALLEAGITLLSIAHRPEVRRFHHVELQLAGDGSGAWSLVPLVAREETV